MNLPVDRTPLTEQGGFLRFVQRTEAWFERASFAELDRVDLPVAYPLQGWPVLVSQREHREVARMTQGLAALIRSLPERVFGGDARRMARFYRLSPASAAEVAGVLRRFDHDDVLMRLDLILGEDGFRCLEVNATTNLGGWEVALYAPTYLGLPLIRRFQQEEGVTLSFRDPLAAVMDHLVDCAERRVPEPGASLNAAIVMPDGVAVPERVERAFTEAYARALGGRREGASGTLSFCTLGELDVVASGVELRGERVRLVMEESLGFVGPAVMDAWGDGAVAVLNGPAAPILSDKRNLAILSELGVPPLFSREEADLVARSVPWTRVLAPGRVEYRGETAELLSLLERRRDDFVIKPGMGTAGEGVWVGLATAPQEWSRQVRRALAAGHWVVQEYVEPVPFALQAGEQGWSEHDVVWGAFAFGRRYGGSFLRSVPSESSHRVINSAQGAADCVLLEVSHEP